MNLKSEQAKKQVQQYVYEGYTLKHAKLIVGCNINTTKIMLRVLFAHGKVYPNYVVGSKHKSHYMLRFEELKSFLIINNVSFVEGNDAPRGGQLGYFIQVNGKFSNKCKASLEIRDSHHGVNRKIVFVNQPFEKELFAHKLEYCFVLTRMHNYKEVECYIKP